MIFLLAAITAVILRTVSHVFNKKIVRDIQPIYLVTTTAIITTIVLFPFFAYSVIDGTVTEEPIGYLGVAGSALFNVLGALALMKGLKSGRLGVAVPMRNLVPLFTLFWGVIFLGETLTFILVPATFMVVFGTFLINRSSLRFSKGAGYGLLSAFMYSIAVIIDKFTLGIIAPRFYVFLIPLVMSVLLMFYNRNRLKRIWKAFVRRWRMFVMVGLITAVGSFFTFTAISLADVTVIVPVFRLEVLTSVIAGGVFFREKHMMVRIIGALLLIAGIILIL